MPAEVEGAGRVQAHEGAQGAADNGDVCRERDQQVATLGDMVLQGDPEGVGRDLIGDAKGRLDLRGQKLPLRGSEEPGLRALVDGVEDIVVPGEPLLAKLQEDGPHRLDRLSKRQAAESRGVVGVRLDLRIRDPDSQLVAGHGDQPGCRARQGRRNKGRRRAHSEVLVG